MIKIFRLHLILMLLVSNNGLSIAQSDDSGFLIPTTNSKAEITQTVASTKIEIDYNRPNTKGRKIFGHLVPFGQIWRTGSDAATRISFSTPVQLGGSTIDSGTYELFTVPDKENWQIILQEYRKQWGSYRYDSTDDITRFSAIPLPTTKTVETFTISIDQVGLDSAVINLAWADTYVPIVVKIDLQTTVIPGLEEALDKEGRRPYFHAAMFYFENNLDINRAAELMKLALDQHPGHVGMLYRQALILESKGDIEGARAAANASLDGLAEVGPELRDEYTRLNNALLKELDSDQN